ncbi:MAG TPA: hypothetical protein VK874_02805 [Gaiellaceae bacterium]|nr:hypothetical protein [Gaiellaceae bacterium]
MRKTLSVAAGALALAAPAHAAPGALEALDARDASAPGAAVQDVAFAPGTRALASVARATWGGTYTTSAGETVRVSVSDTYPVDETAAQSWAEFVGGLAHGPELGDLSVVVAPLEEVRVLCGSSMALGCYDPNVETFYAMGSDDPVTGVSAESVARHEYGHHLAFNRDNAPFSAYLYGPKFWASSERICYRTHVEKAIHPGDEGEFYDLNPAEGFAEAYRVFTERAAATPETAWAAVDQSFYPDDGALEAIRRDVFTPWTKATGSRQLRGTFVKRGRRLFGYRVTTPLDGTLVVRASSPKVKLQLGLFERGKARPFAVSRVGRAVAIPSTVVCGDGGFDVGVLRVSGFGRFTVRVTFP